MKIFLKEFFKWILVIGILVECSWVSGADINQFNAVQLNQYDKLINELRCVTCPNQSIADSMAPIAQAMKAEVIERIEQGQSPEQIIQVLVEHYGDYVVYRPPYNAHTKVLWLGPFVLLCTIILIWVGVGLKNKFKVKS